MRESFESVIRLYYPSDARTRKAVFGFWGMKLHEITHFLQRQDYRCASAAQIIDPIKIFGKCGAENACDDD